MKPLRKISLQRAWAAFRLPAPPLVKPFGGSVSGLCVCLVLLLASNGSHPVFAADSTQQLPSLIRVIEVASTREIIARSPPVNSLPKLVKAAKVVDRTTTANFGAEQASVDARHVANWVVNSGDNGRRPFVIVDKIEAKVFVFDARGKLRGATPALLGLAPGDHTVPGIGERKLATIRPEERTTPAGRFVASLDRDIHGQEVLWVDYDAAISMHRVITSDPKERRLQRLASLVATDRRISYGCINLPVKFYDSVLSPAFKQTDGIVYVLPETRSVREVFASYDVGESKTPEVDSQARLLAPPDNAQVLN